MFTTAQLWLLLDSRWREISGLLNEMGWERREGEDEMASPGPLSRKGPRRSEGYERKESRSGVEAD